MDNANETLKRLLAQKQSASTIATEARAALERSREGQSPELLALWDVVGQVSDLYLTAKPEDNLRPLTVEGVRQSLAETRAGFDLVLADRNLQDAMDHLAALPRDEAEARRRRAALPAEEALLRLRRVQRARQTREGAWIQAVRHLARIHSIDPTPHEVREVARWLAQ